ncbi:protein farnesyltransferase subunit beta-like [Salvia miltiorrhiza]|uniref:protein farnesyltransferase subunit beta-like n=1 Tax=Salvia miltiorrhiza TaxID=226208 RepID=UPI0025AC1D5C|nr:protein farnesyltransferase subunit beta-like [Salvia miltiorrhiza]
MKDASGGFRMHDGGEVDVRACYTAISVASVLNILDDRLIQNVGDYIVSCQTYEGGIAGEPGSEAHGGYAFCGLAAMVLINEADRLDLPGLLVCGGLNEPYVELKRLVNSQEKLYHMAS